MNPINPNKRRATPKKVRTKTLFTAKYCGCGKRRSNRYFYRRWCDMFECTKCGKMHKSIRRKVVLPE